MNTKLPYPITVDPDSNIVGPWRGTPPLAALSLDEKREVAKRANDYPRVIEALAELQALQVNGFDPIAAARAYPKLVEQYSDALTLLSGWIETKSPPRFKAEHRADLEKKYALLRELGEAA